MTLEAARLSVPRVRPAPTDTGTHAHAGHRTPGDLLAIALAAYIALAPLPLGGNRPLFWGVGAALLAAIGFAYAIAMIRGGRRLRVPAARVPDLALPLGLVLVWLVVQLLPLGALGRHMVVDAANGIAVASGTISLDPGSTVLMLVQVAGYGLLGFLGAQVGANQRRGSRVLTAVFWAIVAYALIGLVSLVELGDTILGVKKLDYLGSATATFVNRNSFATFLSFGLAIGLAIVMEILALPVDGERRRRRGLTELFLTIAGLIFVAAALLATQSRMGIFSGGCGALLVLVLGGLRSGDRRWLLGSALVVLLLGAGLAVLYGGGVLERLGQVGSAADVRGALYAQVWSMILANPLLGYGGGAFEMAYPLFHQLPVSPDLVWNKAHSTYLALWSELGLIVGTLPMLAVAAAALRLLVASARRTVPTRLALGALGVIVVGAVHSLADFSLEIQADAQVFVLVLGLAVGAAVGGRRSAGPQGRSANARPARAISTDDD